MNKVLHKQKRGEWFELNSRAKVANGFSKKARQAGRRPRRTCKFCGGGAGVPAHPPELAQCVLRDVETMVLRHRSSHNVRHSTLRRKARTTCLMYAGKNNKSSTGKSDGELTMSKVFRVYSFVPMIGVHVQELGEQPDRRFGTDV